MRYAFLLTVCAAPLAACDKQPEIHERNASVSEVARQVGEAGVASDSFIRAGQWRVTGTMEEMSIPGMPAQAQAQMKQMMGPQHNVTYEYCLTPEEAKRPRGKFFTGKDEGQCRYDRFDMGGGKLDAVMRCQPENARTMTMELKGTYSPDNYSTRVTMNVQGGREGNMVMKMRSEAKRVGECKKQG